MCSSVFLTACSQQPCSLPRELKDRTWSAPSGAPASALTLSHHQQLGSSFRLSQFPHALPPGDILSVPLFPLLMSVPTLVPSFSDMCVPLCSEVQLPRAPVPPCSQGIDQNVHHMPAQHHVTGQGLTSNIRSAPSPGRHYSSQFPWNKPDTLTGQASPVKAEPLLCRQAHCMPSWVSRSTDLPSGCQPANDLIR